MGTGYGLRKIISRYLSRHICLTLHRWKVLSEFSWDSFERFFVRNMSLILWDLQNF